MRIALPCPPRAAHAAPDSDDGDRVVERAEAVAVIAAGCAALAGCLAWLL